jgi:hypothetical protein
MLVSAAVKRRSSVGGLGVRSAPTFEARRREITTPRHSTLPPGASSHSASVPRFVSQAARVATVANPVFADGARAKALQTHGPCPLQAAPVISWPEWSDNPGRKNTNPATAGGYEGRDYGCDYSVSAPGSSARFI